MCNDEIVKLKLNNDEVDKPKNLRKKRKENAFRNGCWLIQHVKGIYINSVFEKHVTSENMYILILYCHWWSSINLSSNRRTNWCYSSSSAIQEIRIPNSLFSKKDSRKKKADKKRKFAITLIDESYYRVNNSSILQEFFFIFLKMFIMQWRKKIRVDIR